MAIKEAIELFERTPLTLLHIFKPTLAFQASSFFYIFDMDFCDIYFAYISLFCLVICWNLTNMVTNNKRWQIRLPLLKFLTLTEGLKSILDEQLSSSVTRWRESSFGEQSRAALESRAAAQNCRKSRNLKPFQLCTTRTSTPTKFQTKPRRDNKCCKTLIQLSSLLAKRCWWCLVMAWASGTLSVTKVGRKFSWWAPECPTPPVPTL